MLYLCPSTTSRNNYIFAILLNVCPLDWAPMKWRFFCTLCMEPYWTFHQGAMSGSLTFTLVTSCQHAAPSRVTMPIQCSSLPCFYFELSYLSLSQVVLAADMLGLEGLKDVAEMVLTRDYCRFFPKVNPGSFSLFIPPNAQNVLQNTSQTIQ